MSYFTIWWVGAIIASVIVPAIVTVVTGEELLENGALGPIVILSVLWPFALILGLCYGTWLVLFVSAVWVINLLIKLWNDAYKKYKEENSQREG